MTAQYLWNELLTNRYYLHLFDTVAGHCVDTWWSHNRRVWACWCCCTGAEQWHVPHDDCSSSLPASGLGCTQQYYSTVERDYHVFCVGYTECIICSVVNTVVVTWSYIIAMYILYIHTDTNSVWKFSWKNLEGRYNYGLGNFLHGLGTPHFFQTRPLRHGPLGGLYIK